MTSTMLLFALAGFLLSVFCVAMAMWARQHAAAGADQSADLFHDWNQFTPEERRRILAGHQARAIAMIAEREREWLQERVRVGAKG
ncbi:hypothetical protein [Azotobacter salinestris]|uniref:hypothetical protein n=1 Tax=Azotobacter salinestris TaxID=69964 RepID=UPI0032DEE942